METKILALGYRHAKAQAAEVWVALDFLSYECTSEHRPQLTPECCTIEDLNEHIDRVIAELETIRLEGQKRLTVKSKLIHYPKKASE